MSTVAYSLNAAAFRRAVACVSLDPPELDEITSQELSDLVEVIQQELERRENGD